MATASSAHAIFAEQLGKRFGTRWALRGASCTVARGEVVGLLGANGSGKSTLLRILGTLMKPNVGTAFILGHHVVGDAELARGKVGFLSHAPGLYEDLTARENLVFTAAMLGLDTNGAIDTCIDRVGLGHVANERVRGFSAGMQRRLALARLMLGEPSVLLFDEPYSNLDAEGVELMNATIASFVAKGASALVALHETAPAQRLLARTITLRNGRFDT
jgi:heme exporter protein A